MSILQVFTFIFSVAEWLTSVMSLEQTLPLNDDQLQFLQQIMQIANPLDWLAAVDQWMGELTNGDPTANITL